VRGLATRARHTFSLFFLARHAPRPLPRPLSQKGEGREHSRFGWSRCHKENEYMSSQSPKRNPVDHIHMLRAILCSLFLLIGMQSLSFADPPQGSEYVSERCATGALLLGFPLLLNHDCRFAMTYVPANRPTAMTSAATSWGHRLW